MSLARINNRVWKSHTEKFIDYAEDKLKLMQSLKLTESEQIELLADGVKDISLRRMVLNTWATTIPEFINQVRRITEDKELNFKRPEQGTRPPYRRENTPVNKKLCFTSKKPGHEPRDCRVGKPTCFKCGQTGHISPHCPKRNGPPASLNHVIHGEEVPTTSSTLTGVVDQEICTLSKNDSCINMLSLGNDKVFCD